MAEEKVEEQPVKRNTITFDHAMAKIINTVKRYCNNQGINNLGLQVYRTGFTVTIDGKVCARNLKNISELNSLIEQISQ